MIRPARNADEEDCFYSRKYHGYLQHAGKASKIKRRARRRERRTAKLEANEYNRTEDSGPAHS